jgi:hypothetical protein
MFQLVIKFQSEINYNLTQIKTINQMDKVLIVKLLRKIAEIMRVPGKCIKASESLCKIGLSSGR